MNQRTLSIYETAWSMHQVGSTINQITQVVSRDRATIYRWFQKIRRIGIREFVRRKHECKARRPRARTPEYVIQKIIDIRTEYGWCGQKIRKELKESHGIKLGLSTIYRWLHDRLVKAAVGVNSYTKHQAIVTAEAPREVIEHDTVDFGDLYAYTAIDIFTKQPRVYIGVNLEMETGAVAFERHVRDYHACLSAADIAGLTHQSDNGSEFQSDFVEAITNTGAKHRYSRPYKKNEQAHIENFNKALRSECLGDAHYAASEQEAVQLRVDEFVGHYFNRRWHMGLPDMMTPAQFRDWYSRDPESAKVALAKV